MSAAILLLRIFRQAEAKAIELKGQSTAQAIEAQAVALSQNPNVVDLHKADRWDGKLPAAMYSNAPLPFFNIGATAGAAKQ